MIPPSIPKPAPPHRIGSLLVALSTAAGAAVVPEPDNVVYGSISLDSSPVTAADDEVAVEARRTLDGPALARYVMGSEPGVGNLYSLAIPLVAAATPDMQAGSSTGETLFIVVTDPTGIRAQASYTVGERGEVARLDFGSSGLDGDGNGIGDAWELAYFGAIGQDPAATNANGRSSLENFEAGIPPNVSTERFELHATLQDDKRVVSFLARAAEGAGYAGYTRYYTLESSPDLGSTDWTGVNDHVMLEGANQTVTLETPRVGPPVFYRGVVWVVETP